MSTGTKLKTIGEESPYLIHCYACMCSTFLTHEQYEQQMDRPDSTWQCPNCRMKDCQWDDENYEKFTQPSDEELR